jgi:hypothetical protein
MRTLRLLLIFATAIGATVIGRPDPVVLAVDVAELRLGGTLDGRIRPQEQGGHRFYMVDMEEGLRLAVPASEVRRVRGEDETMEAYRARLETTPDEAEAQWELARWCRSVNLLPQSERHMRRVIDLDTDHAQARAALGFARHQGQWIEHRLLQQQRGMIRSAGKWSVPEDVAVQRMNDEADVAAKRWVRRLAQLRSQAARGGERGAEAMAQIRGIDDPAAAGAVAKQLQDPRAARSEPLETRLLWVEILGRLRTPAAVEALARTGLDDASIRVREACYDQLEEYGKGLAIRFYLSRLKSSNNAVVQRAGTALSYLNDPEIALSLVEALITEHKEVIPPGQGLNVGFSADGGGGLSTGSQARVINHPINNPSVLAALREIEPEVNYQYDKMRWRQHFAEKLTSYSGDMRRDP